jgi:hypothetical protein
MVTDAVRAAIEAQYTDKCDVIEYQPYTKENKATGNHDVTVFQQKPCKLSYTVLKNNAETDTAEKLIQSVKLFISPDLDIKPGSKISVTHNGRTTAYKNSGMPGVYPTHQEIPLVPFTGWS